MSRTTIEAASSRVGQDVLAQASDWGEQYLPMSICCMLNKVEKDVTVTKITINTLPTTITTTSSTSSSMPTTHYRSGSTAIPVYPTAICRFRWRQHNDGYHRETSSCGFCSSRRRIRSRRCWPSRKSAIKTDKTQSSAFAKSSTNSSSTTRRSRIKPRSSLPHGLWSIKESPEPRWRCASLLHRW
jgi:hypothetical protein